MSDYEIRCPDLPLWIDEKTAPYTAMYFRLYGYKSGMMSTMWDDTGKYKNTEEVYKACIKNHCTWKELLDFRGYPEGVLY